MIVNLDKQQVARRQLGSALALFLNDLDPVSVHTLACAGCEIAEHLTQKAGVNPFSVHILTTCPDVEIKDIKRLQNQYWNAFKHALTRSGVERADEDLFGRFRDEMNDDALFIGWHDFLLGTGRLPIEAQVFQVWYFALYPERLNPAADPNQYEQVFPGLKEMSRADQKRVLRDAIKKYREHDGLMSDPETDDAPLVFLRCQQA